MGSRNRRSRADRLPISFPLKNNYDKDDRGFLPWSICYEFGNQIGRSPSIYTSGGRVFQMRFIRTLMGGVFTTGWNDFIESFNLHGCLSVTLSYHGQSSFFFDELPQNQDLHVENNEPPNSPKSGKNGDSFVCQPSGSVNTTFVFKVTKYSAEKNHQNLPASIVSSCLNLRNKSIILDLGGGRTWKFGLYHHESRDSEARITTGWKAFCADQQLKPGDKISVEVVDALKNHLMAEIIRS